MSEDDGSADVPAGERGPLKDGRNKDGTFAKGFVGNPAGKPKGARHKTTLAVEALLGGEAEKLTRRAIEKALDGDVTALRLCLDRVAPPRKDATVTFALPPMQTAADAIKALGAVAEAVAEGSISPGEGAELGKLVDSFTRAIEAHDLAERIAKLEMIAKR